MTSRPIILWFIFTACLATVLGGMGWMSLALLRLDRADVESRRTAQLEENVRLALWRMDSTLGSLLAQETARPYFTYTSFTPAEQAYTKMFNELTYGDVLIPSPLLGESPPMVRLHFQFAPDGLLTCPQVPTGNMRDIAVARKFVTREQIESAAELLKQLPARLPQARLIAALPPLPKSESPLALLMQNAANSYNNVGAVNNAGPQNYDLTANDVRLSAGVANQETKRGQAEFQARNAAVTNDNIQQYASVRGNKGATVKSAGKVVEGVMRPIWIDNELVLARRVMLNGREYIQGCWIDWPAVRKSLLESVADILPGAAIEPTQSATADQLPRMLASIPARLVPAASPAAGAGISSPIRSTLVIAWVGLLAGSAAVGLLLYGAMALSERRASFVSAVTHELRTPLTTLSMYAEMLESGMVEPPEARQEYLKTLRGEANRLGHLVENVLAYSRIERSNPAARLQRVGVRQLLDEVLPRAVQRLEQAGMTLNCNIPTEAAEATVLADPSAVEQILFNLADNSAKYAVTASDKRFEIGAERDGRKICLRIADHGPGISAEQGRRLFEPFSKSVTEAARSAPGVGLGLALSRRLARQMGGDLVCERSSRDGAVFVLSLPLV